MSYKTEFANNNADLRAIIDKMSALPDRENLDPELAEQDSLIDQIAAVLYEKCTVTIKRPVEAGGVYAKATIDGVEYTNATYGDGTNDLTVTVNKGATITLYVGGGASGVQYSQIVVDGNVMSTGSGKSYSYTVQSDVDVTLVGESAGGGYAGKIDVTTKSTTGSGFTPTDSGGTTYKSKFADNNTDLRAVLGAVENLSGGEVDTCTVVLKTDDSKLGNGNWLCACTQYIDGEFVANGDRWWGSTTFDLYKNPLTLNNVVCGSTIALVPYFDMSGIVTAGGSSTNGSTVQPVPGSIRFLVLVTKTPNVTDTITVSVTWD